MTYKPIKPLILSERDIRAVAPSRREIVGIVEETYRMDAAGQAEVPTKIGVHPGGSGNRFIHAMPAWVAGDRSLGVKLISYYPGNFARGVHDSTGIIVMYDAEDGQPTAIMEGMWITFARTVASAAVAAKHLAVPEPKRLGLVGCGGLGEWSLLTLTDVFPSLREIHVSSRRAESREAFCRRFAGQGPWTLKPVADARAAVEGMDIVISSTPQQAEPRLMGAWWSPGTLAIPLDYPFAWDDAAYAMADVLYSDDPRRLDQYEKAAAGGKRPGLRFPRDHRTLQDLCAGRVAGRADPEARIFAIVTGIASTDVTVAAEIYRRAKQAGLGTEIALT
jgi:ornithine cyclodeaminase/alanine dehydrogenase-like protein (mu-crystallin family)